MSKFLKSISDLTALQKTFIAAVFGLAAGFAFPRSAEGMLVKPVFGWDIFCVVMLALTWYSFATIDASELKEQARRQDESRVGIFVIILVATLASLFAIFLMFTSSDSDKAMHLNISLAIPALMLAWFLVHSVFTHRYAHLYYGGTEGDGDGLEFPGEEQPDFMDFAYFSFVIGMTFQVSDVEISRRVIRRLVLLHGIIAFLFNTFLVALTINVIASLMK